MKRKTIKVNIVAIYKLIQVIILSLMIIYVGIDMLGIHFNKLHVAVGVALLAITIYVLSKCKNKTIVWIVVAGIVIGIVSIAVILKWNPVDIVRGFVKLITGGKIKGVVDTYYFLYIGMVALIVTSLCFILVKYAYVESVMGVIATAGSIVYACLRQDISKITIVLVLFIFLMAIARLLNLIYNKNNRNPEVIDSLTPIFLAMIIGIYMIPTKAEPINWDKAKEAIDVVVDKGVQIVTDIRYALGFTDDEFAVQFGSNAEHLGGDLNQSSNIYLTMYGKRTDGNGYIVCNYKDEYTGKGWKENNLKTPYSSEEYKLDYYEALDTFKRLGLTGNATDDYVKTRHYTLTYSNLRTKTLFGFSRLTGYNTDPIATDTSSSNILIEKSQGTGFDYKTGFMDVDYTDSTVIGILRNLQDFDYADYKNMDDRQQVLEARSDYIYKHYMNLPDTLPDRVYELADTITEGKDNDYDRLKAIEEYVRTYTYTKTPAKTDNEDFVDGFLFDTKEGYCTSYATAMAVLARCEGIPNRYVEGFTVDYSEHSKEKTDTYYVRGTDSHAWVEAYIEGFGWVPFEPTSGYEDGRYGTWTPEAKIVSKKPDYEVDKKTPSEAKAEQARKEAQEAKAQATRDKITIIVAIALVSIIAMIILYVYLYRRKIIKDFEKADNREKIYKLFKKIVNYGEYMGIYRDKDHTLTEYKMEIMEKCEIDETILKVAIEAYEYARYSSDEIPENEVRRVLMCQKTMYLLALQTRKWPGRMFIARPI